MKIRNPFVKHTDTEEKKAKEPQYYTSVIGSKALNYNVYYLTARERITWTAILVVVGGALGYLFYGGFGVDQYGHSTTLTYVLDAFAIGFPACLTVFFGLPQVEKQIRASNLKKLSRQFRDMLDSISTSLISGSNVHNAFLSAQKDLLDQYPPNAFINQEMEILVAALNNNMHIDQILLNFGERSQNADIVSFARVFQVANETGGNMQNVVQQTQNVIGEKMGIQEEIETAVTGSKSDSYIMIFIPVLIVALLKFMGGGDGGFGQNLATPTGAISITIGIVLFAAAYKISSMIMNIKV